MVDNYDSQQQAMSSRQDPFRNIGANANDRDRRENGEGVTSRTQEKERSNDRVEEVDKIEVGNRKRKRQDIVRPLCRVLLGVVVAVLITDPPLGGSIPVALEH